jgi:trimeric autotransporter adhesin
MQQRLLKLLTLVSIILVSGTVKAQDVITTIAGTPQSRGYSGDDGPATAAQLYDPSDITFDKAGNLFIADFANNVIRKVDTFGNITTVAGTGAPGYTGDNGPATAANLNGPYALAIDASGNIIFADGYNHLVRKVNTTTGIITAFAGVPSSGYLGDGGPATAAKLYNPVGIAIDKGGNVYIADDHNNAIRKVDVSGIITTVAGGNPAGYAGDNGPATNARLSLPIGVAIDTAGNLFIADEDNNVIRKVNTSGIITTYAGTGAKGNSGDGGPATAATLDSAQRVNFDDANNMYISDGRNNLVRKVSTAGIIATFAGNGFGADSSRCYFDGEDSTPLHASFCVPQGVAFDYYKRACICDRGNAVIRRIGPPSAVIIDHSGVHNQTSAVNSLVVYPNPAPAGSFTVNLTSGTSEEAIISITNMLGVTIKTFTTTTNQRVPITLQAPPGIYHLSVTTPHGVWTKQVSVR